MVNCSEHLTFAAISPLPASSILVRMLPSAAPSTPCCPLCAIARSHHHLIPARLTGPGPAAERSRTQSVRRDARAARASCLRQRRRRARRSLIIWNLPNGIGSVEQLVGGDYVACEPLAQLGQQWIMQPPSDISGPKEVTVRVKDYDGNVYGEYRVSFPCGSDPCPDQIDADAVKL